ncbi:ubiquitin carboxyl-terminal hydrolase 21 [Daphnia magna]|uniref:ubiquitin carboxyl-terminal hydrolase 21 n=1 Tax=Daphnia magna TaxID=35525 RepID=UPI001E1BC87D|nr:ubiquitin carboxyl-terminal hydrolase 21 [Daphnia magna]XP_045027068.1 ubiquitin carboxyl-terminal hydrolase 21 [Daphnia magna]XP_045027069.1 ubiquitin carboxyl-terminal hydrolase 21 [Daphnia magna]XP_045027070.1 ubiquitin carboxyl-terminal hydrolase 21 [Daphnia magna]XP_045027072.1 ubiquitin carboxyl-terminal hydrolase 21 [Daphnia magna]XP_045027073.1 ubiquitin carboxyl-terminal hydrolase 21 [Daphnia magna]XP_045027074.1 ubiquitin carboxyl-terminal hydrolase 21 [Daphnia magna]XP_04502707
MPVLTSSTSSPSRRLGGSYTSYSSSYGGGGSSYSRSSSTFSSSTTGRTSSLDRSPYSSSYVSSSYKYTSPSVSITRDYSVSSRPPISSTRTSSSLYSSSSTRTSPARSYFSSRKSTSEDGASGSRNRETQSETRDLSTNSNNNYLNGNIKKSRDYSSNFVPSSTLSKYRAERASLTNGSSSISSRTKYSSERDPEVPKISDRIRNFQPSKSVGETPVFRSRFLRSSQPDADKKERQEAENAEDVRPTVSDLRRRYDQNRNHVTPERSRTPAATSTVFSSKPPIGGSKLNRTTASGYGSDSDESVELDGRSTPVNQRLAAVGPAVRAQNSQAPDRIVNGDRASPARPAVTKDVARSSSPSTLSSSSDGDNQDGGHLSAIRSSATSAKLGGARASRHSISDSVDQTSETSSPKLAPRSRTCSSSQSKTTSKESTGLVGLRNIGNTCFMNSVLQCLSNTRSVLEYVISNEYTNHINTSTSSMNGALIKAFAIVLAELWKKDEDEEDSYSSSAVNPTALKSQIQKFAPRFMGYNQQDAQEFLRYLLEGLHEDVNRIAVKPRPLEHDISDDLSDSEKAMESWKRYLRRDDSKIVDLFVGQLKSTLQCTVCGHCSVTFDPFWDLSLPIPPSSKSSVKLYHCLDLFGKEEILDGDEKPTCAKCQTRRKCTKKFTIHKFPQILVLHLKRFSPGERFRKLDASVDFPLTDLDMSAYTSPGIKQLPCSYQLYGVINHSGSAYSGHYTASCRHPFSGNWHEYNDSRISNLTPQRVVSSEAYLLFYELESNDARL